MSDSIWKDPRDENGQSGADPLQQESPHHQVDDGFNVPEQEPDDSAIEDVVTKKKGPNPKLVAGVLGLVTVVAVGFLGANLYKKMNKPKPQPIAAFEVQTPPQAAPEFPAPAVIMDSEAKTPSGAITDNAGVTASADIKPAPAEPDITVPATSVQNIATPPVVKQVAEPVVAAAPIKDVQLHKKVDEIDERITALESSVNKLANNLARPQEQAKGSDTSANKVAALPTKKITSHAAPRLAKTVKAKKSEADKEVKAPELALQLRGVYPPQGEDRQAWVLNPETGAITIVSKGSVIQGLTVVRVEADKVVTNNGIIK